MIGHSSDTNYLFSDDSDDEYVEIDIYRRKYQLLLERCEVLQQDNERLVNRIQQVRRLLKTYRYHRKYLMDRLDQHGDGWRTASLPVELDEQMDKKPTHLANTLERLQFRTGISKASKVSGVKKAGKRSNSKGGARPPADPNAPKRPANPFFQFCQEQRSIVLEQVVAGGHPEPTKQELTKQLAVRWNSLSSIDKKIYYDMYKQSKERYTVDMQLYSLNKARAT